jgi:hypothetical protein
LPELRSSGSYSSAPAAINGFSERHLTRVISAGGFHDDTDRADRDRRDESLRPAVDAILPACA